MGRRKGSKNKTAEEKEKEAEETVEETVEAEETPDDCTSLNIITSKHPSLIKSNSRNFLDVFTTKPCSNEQCHYKSRNKCKSTNLDLAPFTFI